MNEIHAVNFAPFPSRGVLAQPQTRLSLEAMAKETEANWVILCPGALQRNAHSEQIVWQGDGTPEDDELLAAIRHAQSLGLKVALKPTVNCLDGTWRAHIGFFDWDIPGEPNWGNWFAAYTAFQLHYAKLAEQSGCEMLITGCEMVQAEHRETEWRALLAAVRGEYAGAVSYNTDKYCENHVAWWDAVDVISASGYYPTGSWQAQLDRIETVVKQYNKPFFFAECGCMNIRGSEKAPNNWELQGVCDDAAQAVWYGEMFAACRERSWFGGYGIWDWPADTAHPSAYAISGRPALRVVADAFRR